jgi:hypothetical protein
MRINLISVSVLAVSALGLGGLTVDKARAYVLKKPDGAYAPLALQMLVELEARRLIADGDTQALQRRLLIDDLVYRPGRGLKAIKAAYDSTEAFKGIGEPAWKAKPDTSGAPQARKAIQYLEIRSKRFSSELRRCRQPPPLSEYLNCLADAVEVYAQWVEEMPPTPHSVAPVAAPALRESARRIRASQNVEEARVAVAEVVAEVRKSIDLVPAGGEDTVRRLELSQRSVIVASMSELDNNLVMAVGI